jgi:YVTN family beta-propeller protein
MFDKSIIRWGLIFAILISLGVVPLAYPANMYVITGPNWPEDLHVVDSDNGSITDTINNGQIMFDMVLNPAGTLLYCTSADAFADPPDPGLVSVINTATNSVIDTINVNSGAYTIAINPTGTSLYVASDSGSYRRDTLAVIDTMTNQVTDSIFIGHFIQDIAVSPDGTTLYISSDVSGIIIVMSASTFQILTTISGLPSPIGLAINPQGTRLYAACEDGPVSVINTATRTVIENIDCGDELDAMAISPDGATLYVPHYYDGYYSVVDTATNTVNQTVTYSSFGNFFMVDAVATNQDGTQLYIGAYDSDPYTPNPTLFVFETATNQLIDTLQFEDRIFRVAILESDTTDRKAMPWIPLLLLDE